MPRGDAEKLKADTEDGYTRIANLLLEALIAAPLTAIELRIILFVARRTYGWAKPKDHNTGKADVMTADDIARGLCISPRTVERPLTGLVRNGLLLRMPLEFEKRGVRCAYGVNTHLDEWGSGPDWSLFRTQLREAQQADAYTLASVVPVRWIAYRQYAEERSASTLPSVVTGPLSPTPAGAPEPLTASSYNQGEEREGETTLDYSHMAACHDPFCSAVVKYFHDVKPPPEAQTYALEMKAQLSAPGAGITEEQVLAELETCNGPHAGGEMDQRFGPGKYLERLLRDRTRASPKRLGTAPADRSRFAKGALGK
jgi:phage replication O-like protein O